MPEPAGRRETLSAGLRHGYGFAALAIAVANTAVMFFLLKYLVDGAALSPAVAGTVLLVAKTWDAVVDPLIGRLSDASRARMGARRVWIAGGALPFALLFGAIWWGLPVRETAAALAYAALLVAYSTAYSSVVVPYGALTPVLTRDYDERTRLNAARMGWSMVGGIVAGVGLPAVLARTGSWRMAGIALATLLLPPVLVLLRVTRGRDVATAGTGSPPMWTVLRNRAFRRTVALFAGAWSMITALSSLVPFYVEHHLGRPERLDLLFAVIQSSALAAVPAVTWLAVRGEKHRAFALAIGSWALVMLGLAAVPGAAPLWAVLAVAALVGPGVAAAHVLPWSMLPDVVEADRAQCGRERAGAFYGVMTFAEQVASALAIWCLGLGLEVAGYVEGAAVQPEGARMAIRLLIGPGPAVVLGATAIGAWLLPPMTRQAHRAILERLGG